jgi:hypothetical protein
MKITIFFAMIFFQVCFAQSHEGVSVSQVEKMIDQKLASKWTEKIMMKGYAQFRYNRFAETNEKLTCSTCDKSIGDKQGLFMRRARLVFFGQVNKEVFFYIQPDYASDASTNQNYLQIRDAYFDYNFNQYSWRIRTGVSKVPFGFVNLQSSSIRAPLDRDDALNSAAPNERDLGVFLMFAPEKMRKRFKELAALKGSGDYGVFSFGVYNGQSLNKKELNNDLHKVVRLTYPYKLEGGQFIEASVQAYVGKYVIENLQEYYDRRQAVSLIIYPQPIGFQAEYNIGEGPEYNPNSNSVENKNLQGGYAQLNYQMENKSGRYFPFVRFQEYQGGKKLENGALSRVNEWEIGTEWQPDPAVELTMAYAFSERTTQSSLTNKNDQSGGLLRLQAQFNY